jgi:hypothetical protein
MTRSSAKVGHAFGQPHRVFVASALGPGACCDCAGRAVAPALCVAGWMDTVCRRQNFDAARRKRAQYRMNPLGTPGSGSLEWRTEFYLLSHDGRVFRGPDLPNVPNGDISRFDYDAARGACRFRYLHGARPRGRVEDGAVAGNSRRDAPFGWRARDSRDEIQKK